MRACVQNAIGGSVHPREPLPRSLEWPYAQEREARRLALQVATLGPVAEKPEFEWTLGVGAFCDSDQGVPALFRSEAPHRDHERPRVSFEQFRTQVLVAGDGGVEDGAVDTERHENDPLATMVKELRFLRARGDKGALDRSRDRANPGPKRLHGSVGERARDVPFKGRSQVGVDEVGVPDERAHRGEFTGDSASEEPREVRGVQLEDVRAFGLEDPPQRARSREQVVRRVVRGGWARKPHDDAPPRTRCPRRVFDPLVAGAWGDDGGVVAELARKLILGVQMASHSSPALRVEFGEVHELHPSTPTPRAPVDRKQDALARRGIDAQGKLLEAIAEIPAFAELAARAGRPLKIAILSDFTRIPYANGAVFQTRFLYRALRRCGHQVTLIGPRDPDAVPGDVPEGTIELPSLPLAAYPGVHLPRPSESWVYDAERFDFDLIFAQTTTPLVQFGLWLKAMRGTPVICVNTTHLTMAYEVLLPDALAAVPAVHKAVLAALSKPFEISYSSWYNASDGLVVLSEGLRTYWRERGVTVPIHVVPRTVTPENFDRPMGDDPYARLLAQRGLEDGPRLLCAGRHTREKSQDRVIRIFAKHVVPVEPNAVLAMVGIGPDTARYEAIAAELGVGDRVLFTGERPFTEMLDFYAYSDVFVHASLSETYGNVLGEALWCGCPTVAFADGMGASSQVTHDENGLLVEPGAGPDGMLAGDVRFGRGIIALIQDGILRARLGRAASKRARARHTPAAIERRMAEVFQAALDASANRLHDGGAKPTALGRVLKTAGNFLPWTASMMAMYVAGFLRPSDRKDWGSSQPTIA